MGMQTYTSTQPFYDGSMYYKPGQSFSTDAEAKDEWTKVKPADAAAISASIEPVPDDASLEGLSKYALEAIAFMKHVPAIDKLDKPGLITAIKASYEPKL